VSGLDAVSTPGIVPADVRNAGAQAEQTYRAALGFERTLLEQLTKSLSKGTLDGVGEGGGESAATSAYRDMLPGTLADAVAGAGGLGVAHDLFLSMRSTS